MSNVLNLQASVVGSAQIKLSWLLGTYDDDGDGNSVFVAQIAPAFRIRRTTNAELTENEVIFESDSDVQEFTDTTVAPGNIYRYQVQEADEDGEFTVDFSDSITVNFYSGMVTTAPHVIDYQWKFGGTVTILRWKISKDIFTAGGAEVLNGIARRLYGEIECVVDGDKVIIPETTWFTTTDSTNPKATYDFAFHSPKGAKYFDYKLRYQMPHTLGAYISWNALTLYNAAKPIPYINRNGFTVDESSQLVTAMLLAVVKPPASDTLQGMVFLDTLPDDPLTPTVIAINSPIVDDIYEKASFENAGRTELTKIPDIPAAPIAVGANETSFVDALKTKRYGDYTGTFAARVAALTAAYPVALKPFVVADAVSVPASTVIPANIQLTKEGDGMIDVANLQTLTVHNLRDPGEVQFFTGLGTTILKRFEIPVVLFKDLAATLLTTAITKARASLVANGYGQIILPPGAYTTGAIAVMPNNSDVVGAGHSYGASGFGTRLTAVDDGTGIFKVGNLSRNNRFSDFELDSSNVLLGVGILAEGSAPNSAFGLDIERVSFVGGSRGVKVNSLAGQWQIEQITLRNCRSFGVDRFFECDSGNSSVDVETVYISLNADGIGFDLIGVGLFQFRGGSTIVSNGNNNTTGFLVTGEHLGMDIVIQDEGLTTLLQNDVAFVNKGIWIHDSLIQSAIRLNEPCLLDIDRSTLPAESIYDSPGALSTITMRKCTFAPHPANPVYLAKTLQLSNGTYESVSNGGKQTKTFTVNVGTNIATFPANEFRTGSRIKTVSTTTLPAPLAPDTNYWLRQVNPNDVAPTQFYFCTTLINACAVGLTVIDLTTTGTGTHTATLPAAEFGNNLTTAILNEYDRVTYETLIRSNFKLKDSPTALAGFPEEARFEVGESEADKVLDKKYVANSATGGVAVDGNGNEIAYVERIRDTDKQYILEGKQLGYAGYLVKNATFAIGLNGTRIKEKRIGQLTLIAGTKTIADALITANSKIAFQRFTDGGTVGASYSYTRNAGVGFVVTAKDGAGARNTTDTSILDYYITEV